MSNITAPTVTFSKKISEAWGLFNVTIIQVAR